MNLGFSQNSFDLKKDFTVNTNLYGIEQIWLEDGTFFVPISFNTPTYTLENGTVITNNSYVTGQISHKILILRYDENLNLLNYFTLNSTGSEQILDVTADINKNIYISYLVQNNYTLNGQPYLQNTSNNLAKVMLVRIDPLGNVNWIKTFQGRELTRSSLTIANNGAVYIGAKMAQSELIVDGITYPNPTPHNSMNLLYRMIVGKLNLNGPGLEWINSSSNSTTESFDTWAIFDQHDSKLHVDSQNNLYLMTNLRGHKATFGSHTVEKINSTIEWILVKYSSSGNVLWVKKPSISTNQGTVLCLGSAIDKEDNIFIIDNTETSGTVNYWGNQLTADKPIATLLKLNTDGNVIWTKRPQTNPGSYNVPPNQYNNLKLFDDSVFVNGVVYGFQDYGNNQIIDTNYESKWAALEFNKYNGNVENSYILDCSFNVYPEQLVGIDSQNRLWYNTITAINYSAFNYYIGNFNFSLPYSGNNSQKLIFFRSSAVTLDNKKFNKNIEVSIYPNPTSQILNIIGDELLNAKYKIYDLNGKSIQYGNINDNKIDVENISSGLYTIQITNENSLKTTLKFIKK